MIEPEAVRNCSYRERSGNCDVVESEALKDRPLIRLGEWYGLRSVRVDLLVQGVLFCKYFKVLARTVLIVLCVGIEISTMSGIPSGRRGR